MSSFQKLITFPFKIQVRYCQKLDFDLPPNFKFPKVKNRFQNQYSLFKLNKILPQIGFRASPNIKLKKVKKIDFKINYIPFSN